MLPTDRRPPGLEPPLDPSLAQHVLHELPEEVQPSTTSSDQAIISETTLKGIYAQLKNKTELLKIHLKH